MVAKIKNASQSMARKLLSAILDGTDDNQKYARGVFQSKIAGSDYDYVRAMYNTIGIKSFGKFIDE